jgi:jumonji domain-containing protein 7
MPLSEFISDLFDSRRRWLEWQQQQEQQQQRQGADQQGQEGPPDVPYLQAQNGSLREETPALVDDVEEQLAWAKVAFGVAPEAVNIFIGDERSQTTFHKDHYENIYSVVAGVKV